MSNSLNHIHIWYHSLTTETPGKYERDMQQVTVILMILENRDKNET